MKIKHFMMMTMAAVALVFGVSSCGGDDDVTPVPDPLANQVAGNYSGTEIMTVSGDIDETDNILFQFTKANDTTVDLVIPAYGEGMMTLPELPVKGIILYKEGDNIAGALSQGSYSGTVKNAKGEEKTYVVSDFMVLYSTKDNAVMVTFKLKYGNMPFDFDGVFTGQKLLK